MRSELLTDGHTGPKTVALECVQILGTDLTVVRWVDGLDGTDDVGQQCAQARPHACGGVLL
jgi:hypothetical protein